MNFTIYNISTGQIIQSGVCLDVSIQNVPEGCALIEIESDAINQYIENGIAVNFPTKPDVDYIFDYTTKTWIQNIDIKKQSIISQRNSLLYKSDWTQLPNSPLTQQKQQEWATYRQALRDITAQSNYPTNIIWPTEPR